jgi:hypothetical protein
MQSPTKKINVKVPAGWGSMKKLPGQTDEPAAAYKNKYAPVGENFLLPHVFDQTLGHQRDDSRWN